VNKKKKKKKNKKKKKKKKKNKSKQKLAAASDPCLYSFVPPHRGTKENVGWCHCLFAEFVAKFAKIPRTFRNSKQNIYSMFNFSIHS